MRLLFCRISRWCTALIVLRQYLEQQNQPATWQAIWRPSKTVERSRPKRSSSRLRLPLALLLWLVTKVLLWQIVCRKLMIGPERRDNVAVAIGRRFFSARWASAKRLVLKLFRWPGSQIPVHSSIFEGSAPVVHLTRPFSVQLI